MKAAPSFDDRDVPPILHLYETEDSFMNPDLQFLRSIRPASLHTEKIDALHHAHFTTIGFASAALPELARLTRAPADIAGKVGHLASVARRFLDLYLKPTQLATSPG